MLGIRRPPDLVRIVRWPQAIPQYEVGHHGRIDAIATALRHHPGLLLAGSAYRGPGIADCVRVSLGLADSIAPSTAASPRRRRHADEVSPTRCQRTWSSKRCAP